MDFGIKTNDCYLNNAAEPVDTTSHCSSDDLYIKVTECGKAGDPPADAVRAQYDLGATTKVESTWTPTCCNDFRLNSLTTAHISAASHNSKKDYWVEIDFLQTHEVYQVVLKKRHKNTGYTSRIIPKIWLQYKDPEDSKWKWYPHNNGIIDTGMTPEMDSEFEMKFNVIPFNALGVAIWAPFSPSNSHASLRADVVVSRPAPEGADPPADAKMALMEMGASYQVSSFANPWVWKEPRLDA